MWAITETFYAQVIASIAVVLAAVVPTIVVTLRKQNQVHEENRADHQYTATLVKEMHTDMGYLKEDMSLVKIDMRDIRDDIKTQKDDIRNQAVRITNLEEDLAKAPDPAMLPAVSTGE